MTRQKRHKFIFYLVASLLGLALSACQISDEDKKIELVNGFYEHPLKHHGEIIDHIIYPYDVGFTHSYHFCFDECVKVELEKDLGAIIHTIKGGRFKDWRGDKPTHLHMLFNSSCSITNAVCYHFKAFDFQEVEPELFNGAVELLFYDSAWTSNLALLNPFPEQQYVLSFKSGSIEEVLERSIQIRVADSDGNVFPNQMEDDDGWWTPLFLESSVYMKDNITTLPPHHIKQFEINPKHMTRGMRVNKPNGLDKCKYQYRAEIHLQSDKAIVLKAQSRWFRHKCGTVFE